MAGGRRCLSRADALLSTVLLALSFGHQRAGASRVVNAMGKDVLQAHTHGTAVGTAGEAGGAVAGLHGHCASARCLKHRRSDQDERFLNYITDFAESPHGLLLDDIIRVQMAEPEDARDDAQAIPTQLKLDITKLQHGRAFYNISWDLTNVIVVLASAAVFVFLALRDPLSKYALATVSAHVICALLFGLTHDIMPLWMLMPFSLATEVALCALLQNMDNAKRKRLCVFSACLVKANLLYTILAVIPVDAVSPEFTGFAGIIAIDVLRTSNFMVIRLLYTAALGAIAACFYNNLPPYVAGEPSEPAEIGLAAKTLRKIVLFVAAWPVAALVPQIFCITRKARNPIGPYTFFFAPTQFRVNEAQTWVALLSWGLAGLMFNDHTRINGTASPRPALRDVQWWRTSSASDSLD